MQRARGRRSLGTTLIAFGKVLQVTLVLAAGIAALLFVDRLPPESLQAWADAFAPRARWLQQLADKLASAGDHKLAVIGAASLAYAALFTVEGVGLWLGKRWAEYLTAIVTGSFIPFELYGLFRTFSVIKLVTVVINTVVVVYLTVRLVRERRSRRRDRA